MAVLCLVTFVGRTGSADGIIVRPGAASLEIATQTGNWGTLIVSKAVAPVQSWVVAQAQGSDGGPASVLGYTPIPAGTSTGLSITLDPTQGAVNTLVVSIVADRGRRGAFEYSAGSASGGGGGMGGGAPAAQGAEASVPATRSVDKPLVSGGVRVSVVVAETSRNGAPGVVTREVKP